jgi:hypothetical protein
MSGTIQIARDRLAEYFDAFTKRFLRDGSPKAIDVEVLEPDLGDQYALQGARLVGITYAAGTNTLEVALAVGDYRVADPQDVWVIEEPDGFLNAIEVALRGGSRELMSVKRVGLRRLDGR